MNIFNFRSITYLFLFTFLLGCNKNDNPLKQNSKEGGLVEVKTTTVVYFLNTMSDAYDVELKYYQGVGADISSIEVYKQFFTTDSVGNPISSDKTLFKSIDLTQSTIPGFNTYTASFNELASDTKINGSLIPQLDDELNPGFYWELTYVIKLDDGRSVKVNENTVFINSRFAGVYNVIEAEYYRIGVLTYGLSDWPATVNVTALNATTLKMDNPCEPFGTNSVYFTIDDASGDINVLKSYAGTPLTINGVGIATCSTEPGAFNSVPCLGSNTAIKVATSKDTIKITYGYVTPGSGPREFYQVMVKQ